MGVLTQLRLLDAAHQEERRKPKRLRVFYGWVKVNKVRKKEGISVIFENDEGNERSMKTLRKFQDTVYTRSQTEEEMLGTKDAIRMFSEYEILLSDKNVQGSLRMALDINSKADAKQVSEEERLRICAALENAFMARHKNYREPQGVQLELF